MLECYQEHLAKCNCISVHTGTVHLGPKAGPFTEHRTPMVAEKVNIFLLSLTNNIHQTLKRLGLYHEHGCVDPSAHDLCVISRILAVENNFCVFIMLQNRCISEPYITAHIIR